MGGQMQQGGMMGGGKGLQEGIVQDSTTPTIEDGIADCSGPVVILQTGHSTTCDGGNLHAFPVGGSLTDCHAWGANGGGRAHYNSASAMQCNGDGSFSYTQYAGNLYCQGNGVVKTVYFDRCEQDFPPSLWTTGNDLSWCTSGTGPIGNPSVSVPGGQIFLNGQVCGDSPSITEVAVQTTEVAVQRAELTAVVAEEKNAAAASEPTKKKKNKNGNKNSRGKKKKNKGKKNKNKTS